VSKPPFLIPVVATGVAEGVVEGVVYGVVVGVVEGVTEGVLLGVLVGVVLLVGVVSLGVLVGVISLGVLVGVVSLGVLVGVTTSELELELRETGLQGAAFTPTEAKAATARVRSLGAEIMVGRGDGGVSNERIRLRNFQNPSKSSGEMAFLWLFYTICSIQ
jgi:hypothetical protein